MEDAHIAKENLLLSFGVTKSAQKTSLFGVFDGHGGKEVAHFCEDRFALEIISLTEFHESRFEAALRRTFHRMDELLEDPQYEPLLARYRQIPNPSERDKKLVARESGPRVLPDLADVDSKDTKKLSQTMEMLQQLLVREVIDAQPDAPPAEKRALNVNTSEDISPVAPILPSPVVGKGAGTTQSEKAMVCSLKDHRVMAGCTAVVALKVDNMLYVANAGDSRAVLCRAGGVAYPLSEDHKPNQPGELARINAAGGFVNQIGRVNGNLNLSRSLGDLKYKQVPGVAPENQIITAEPDITVTTLAPDDRFMILACDGVWDCLTCQQACDFVTTNLDAGVPLKELVEKMLLRCVAEDPRKTGGIGGDNMTSMVVLLNVPDNGETSSQAAAVAGEEGVTG